VITRLALSLSASIVIGAACLVAGCGESSTSATQPDTSTRSAANDPAQVRVRSSARHCSGTWLSTDRVVVNFSNASSYRLDFEVSQKNTKNRLDRFTLAPKSAPDTVRCSGGATTGKDLQAQVEWNEQWQYQAWKNAASGSDVVYCCDIMDLESRKLHEPGDSTSFSMLRGKPTPFTTTVTLESVKGGIPHFDVMYTDR